MPCNCPWLPRHRLIGVGVGEERPVFRCRRHADGRLAGGNDGVQGGHFGWRGISVWVGLRDGRSGVSKCGFGDSKITVWDDCEIRLGGRAVPHWLAFGRVCVPAGSAPRSTEGPSPDARCGARWLYLSRWTSVRNLRAKGQGKAAPGRKGGNTPCTVRTQRSQCRRPVPVGVRGSGPRMTGGECGGNTLCTVKMPFSGWQRPVPVGVHGSGPRMTEGKCGGNTPCTVKVPFSEWQRPVPVGVHGSGPRMTGGECGGNTLCTVKMPRRDDDGPVRSEVLSRARRASRGLGRHFVWRGISVWVGMRDGRGRCIEIRP